MSPVPRSGRCRTELRTARGEAVCGFKVGCTSAAIQAQFGLAQPVRSYLWQGERRQHGAALDASAFRALAVEGELAVYVLDASAADALDWEVEWAPVVELHHYVWDGDPPSSVELVARNAIQAGVVEAAASARRRGRLRDVPSAGVCTIRINGEVVVG